MAQPGFAFVGLDARSLANIELRVEVQRKMINIFAITKVIPAGAKVLIFIQLIVFLTILSFVICV
ncbi:MAG: hypothetical protein KAS21_05185 [Candidatus Aminicenantes bacterium]|nr:hypothetical protein [Candidatus Aminicenantes bacterium]